MEFTLKDFKIYCFQEEYTKYNGLLQRIQSHIQLLFKNNILGINDRNLRLSNLYKIIGESNDYKKQCISILEGDDENELLETDSSHEENDLYDNYDDMELSFKILVNNLNSLLSLNGDDITKNYKIIYEYLCMVYSLPKNTHNYFSNKIDGIELLLDEKLLYPLNSIKYSIKEFAQHIGLNKLSDILILSGSSTDLFSEKEKDLFELYDNIFTPISVIELNESNEHNFNENDMLEIMSNSDFFTINLFFKQITDPFREELLDNHYSLYLTINECKFKIDGYFKLDPLQINIRLMTLNGYEKIFIKKNLIESKLPECEKFKRKYLKYCSIQELICLSTDKFLKYLDAKYKKFNEVNNKSFPSLMKDFIGKNMNLLNWYEIIKLLLLGSDENINVAGSLYSLLKDKKTNISLVPDIIYDNLVFCNQMKLKKINQTLKIELDKLNELNFESIDLKKELARSTHIPLYVRSLAMEKINEMKLNNNDYNKQLTYVKTVLQFPWPSSNDDNIFHTLNASNSAAVKFLSEIDERLDKTTYGHKKVKEQISLLITKWISNPMSSGSAIGLLGPPGVGKTLIAKSLSKVLDIPMVMITLGGQNDSELLIGHGYTYSGAQPGMIIKKMCEASRGRCIMYFDELDKSCAKHGQVNEITSILIHLTDPNTNKAFQDRFFQGIDFPLDKVIFIASYNDSNKIDPILLDRIIELEVKPYNIEDKINILRDYIIPELKENIGISKEIIISEETMKKFIYDFTSEAGVRDLKHKTEQVFLNINKRSIIQNTKLETITITYELIQEFLGEKNKNHRKMVPEKNMVGYINGLYATTAGGGGITSIEILPLRTGDASQLILTGSMGDVMKESIRVAYTRACAFIEDHKELFKIDKLNDYIKEHFPSGFHVHAPEGATPKDGPSAGAAFTVGFISVLLKQKANRLVAMTGEINLSGKVTKIGGLVYKLIGAKFAGVKIALVPFENKTDIEEIKQTHADLFSNDFTYKYVDNLIDVVKHTLVDIKSIHESFDIDKDDKDGQQKSEN
jgi:endopeptidase La